MEDYKSVLVKNNTKDCQVTLYVYSRYDPVCWLSSSSKILRSGESHLHRSEKEFKFEIKTINKSSKKTVVVVRKWTRNTHITIYNREDMKESDLENHALDKTICIRKLNVEKEASLDEGRNLYEILKLNFEDIRKLKKDDQDEKIKKAFHREIRRWHFDIAGELGDNEMAHEVIVAYDILRNREKRAEYHNKANYSKGWLSIARWRSIFWTECETDEQKDRYRKRLVMMAVSLGVAAGGLAFSVLTAGAAAPALVAVGGTLGAGCFGGGVQSLMRSVSRKSIEEGCDIKDYAKSFALGFTAGAVTGGAAVGIAAGIAGIGSAATQTASTTFGQYIGMGTASAASGGAAFSLAADAEKKFVDGIDLTWKQVVGHAAVGVVIGGATGTAVGAVVGAMAGMSAEVSATNIEGRMVSGVKRLGVSVAKKLSKGVTDKTTAAVLGSAAAFIEERLDDEQENRPLGEHLKDVGTQVISDNIRHACGNVVVTTGTHAVNEVYVNCVHNQLRNEGDADLERLSTEQERRQMVRYDLDRNNSFLKWNDCDIQATYTPPAQTKERETVRVPHNMDYSPDNIITCARFRYIPQGPWKSKMIVEYKYNGNLQKEEITKSTNAIEIPIQAENVKVYFKVMRFIFTWCDVKKWDRYKKKWYEEPHIFMYERPPEQRTFTLSGPLYFEGVIHVTNEKHDDVCEM